MKIRFYNHWHTGDVFHAKGYLQDLQRQRPDIDTIQFIPALASQIGFRTGIQNTSGEQQAAISIGISQLGFSHNFIQSRPDGRGRYFFKLYTLKTLLQLGLDFIH